MFVIALSYSNPDGCYFYTAVPLIFEKNSLLLSQGNLRR